MTRAGTFPGHADTHTLNRGERTVQDWLPGEVDVSIRPGWFYHAREDQRVRSPANLMKIYYESVGRGANLILNIPPDRRGRIHENDVKSLLGWRKLLDATFGKDLAQGAKATASNVRGNDEQFAAANVLTGKPGRYWATDDNVTTAELTLDLGKPVTFNVAGVREICPLGQRIDEIAIDAWDGRQWQPFATATSVGSQRLLRGKSVTAAKVRLRVTKAAACPAISEFALFLGPE